MPSYEVKIPFYDKNTNDLFGSGSEYYTEDPERVKFLQDEGYLGKEIIEDSEEDTTGVPVDSKNDVEKYHTGGGWYTLPNGDKVRGEDKAITALKELEQEKGDE
jgi:hypothetical protein